jgi:NADH:ubiquinone oxidoreductase subunit H
VNIATGLTLTLFNTLTILFIINDMKNNLTILNLANVLVIIIPMLLGVAFMTIIERKQLAAHQRRVGPQVTGYWGVLQP